MKILSHQEEQFLLNPSRFNDNYRYVLTHRIKGKVTLMKNELDFISKHERSLLRNRQKTVYDAKLEVEQFKRESNKRPITYFIPNFSTRIRELDRKINYLGYYIKSDKWVERVKTLDEHKRNILDLALNQLQSQLQQHIDLIGDLRIKLKDVPMVGDK
ncbi:MAG: hypothetical protein KKC68_01015 [Candidatus Thermoplasmatota archaeon]|nr:hypothetical protein [Candidatus Thermoplasmatota archaeon]